MTIVITRLLFLDPLLFGETSKLKSLDIRYNAIGEQEMGSFIEKLRQIRGLKYFAICDNDCWES